MRHAAERTSRTIELQESQSGKDRRSLTGAALALGPTLLAEAAAVLGDYEQESADVLQDFCVYLLEGRLRYSPAEGPLMPWMCGLVRILAQRRRAERERDRGNWDWNGDTGG